MALPLKPRVEKIHGSWCILVPTYVFGDAVFGTVHGVFDSWPIAVSAAIAMNGAIFQQLQECERVLVQQQGMN